MKHRKNIIEQLQLLPYFYKKDIYQISDQYPLKKGTIDAYIKYALLHNELVQLKKGCYVTANYLQNNKTDSSYTFYLANILRQPSYVSLWSALQYYDLATEAIYSITSVTSKITRSYNNKIGNFIYHSIKKEFFTGFSLIPGNFNFFIASPSKAVFDIIYFKTNQFRSMHIGELQTILDDLRIDITEMDKKEQKKFHTIIKQYCK